MTKMELAKRIYDISHLTGEFTLRSGQVSYEYFDKYLFESDPLVLSSIAKYLSASIPEDTEILAGLEMGGIPIATAISINTKMPTIFVRKSAKEYGTCKLAEGVDYSNKKVCVVEDVVTTGGAIIDGVAELRKRGALIDSVVCVIERDVKGRNNLKDIGLELIPLFTMDELKEASTTS